MRNRVISLSVTLMVLFWSACFFQSGKTDPVAHATFPNRTHENRVLSGEEEIFALINNFSIMSFETPMIFTGFTALSVEIPITFLTLFFKAVSIIFCAPIIFVFTASYGLYSHRGTCLSAAA